MEYVHHFISVTWSRSSAELIITNATHRRPTPPQIRPLPCVLWMINIKLNWMNGVCLRWSHNNHNLSQSVSHCSHWHRDAAAALTDDIMRWRSSCRSPTADIQVSATERCQSDSVLAPPAHKRRSRATACDDVPTTTIPERPSVGSCLPGRQESSARCT